MGGGEKKKCNIYLKICWRSLKNLEHHLLRCYFVLMAFVVVIVVVVVIVDDSRWRCGRASFSEEALDFN